MQPGRQADLTARIASLHGYGGTDPSDERIREQLEAKGRGALWAGYAMLRQQEQAMRAAGQDAQADVFAQAARTTLQGWYDSGDVVIEPVATPALQEQVRNRHELGYARRFDPMRSTVEHDALRRRKVDVASEAANLRRPHAELCAEFGVPELEQAYQRRVDQDLARGHPRCLPHPQS
jgi:hypothetical protein